MHTLFVKLTSKHKTQIPTKRLIWVVCLWSEQWGFLIIFIMTFSFSFLQFRILVGRNCKQGVVGTMVHDRQKWKVCLLHITLHTTSVQHLPPLVVICWYWVTVESVLFVVVCVQCRGVSWENLKQDMEDELGGLSIQDRQTEGGLH